MCLYVPHKNLQDVIILIMLFLAGAKNMRTAFKVYEIVMAKLKSVFLSVFFQ